MPCPAAEPGPVPWATELPELKNSLKLHYFVVYQTTDYMIKLFQLVSVGFRESHCVISLCCHRMPQLPGYTFLCCPTVLFLCCHRMPQLPGYTFCCQHTRHPCASYIAHPSVLWRQLSPLTALFLRLNSTNYVLKWSRRWASSLPSSRCLLGCF